MLGMGLGSEMDGWTGRWIRDVMDEKDFWKGVLMFFLVFWLFEREIGSRGVLTWIGLVWIGME